jgi:hypothetical protein
MMLNFKLWLSKKLSSFYILNTRPQNPGPATEKTPINALLSCMHLSLIGRTYVLAALLQQQQPVHYYSQSTAAVKNHIPSERAGRARKKILDVVNI